MNKQETKKNREKERRDQEYHLRMTKSEMDLLDMLSYEEDRSKTETFVKALKFYANYRKGVF